MFLNGFYRLLNEEPLSDGASAPGSSGSNESTSASTKVGLSFSDEPQSSDFEVPEAYRDRKYLEGVKSIDDVYKQLDNAQSLIGKRPAGIPHENAPQEEWDKFYSNFGRPETPDNYEFDNSHYPEGVEPDADELKLYSEIAHKAGLSQKQANLLRQEFEKASFEGMKTEEQLGEEFDAMAREKFGDKHEQMVEKAASFLKENVNGYDPSVMEGMSNEALLMMTDFVHNIHSKYASEDTPPNGSPAHAGVDRRAEASRLMNHPAYNNALHPEHDSIREQLNNLYKGIK